MTEETSEALAREDRLSARFRSLTPTPVPVQTTVIRWDRVVLLAGLCLMALVGAVIWWVKAGSDDQTKEGAPDVAVLGSTGGREASAASEPLLQPSASRPAAPDPAAPELATPEPAAPEPVAPQPAAPQPATPQPAAPQPAAPQPATPQPAAPPSALADASNPEADSPAGPEYTIATPDLLRLQLSWTVRDFEPLDRIESVVSLAGRDLLRVYLFTELAGSSGQTVYHDWYLGDTRVARVPVRVTRDPMRISTSKRINSSMLGGWRAEAVREDGSLLGRVVFRVE